MVDRASTKPAAEAKDGPQPDVMDPIADDAADIDAPSEPVVETAPEPTADEPKALEIDTSGADRRADIAKRYREKRSAEGPETHSLADKTEGDKSSEKSGADDGADNTVDARAPQEKIFTLKVDGREIKKSESEVLALAQMYEAGHSRLDTSKEVLGSIKALRDQLTLAANQRGVTGESAAKPDSSIPTASSSDAPTIEPDAPALDIPVEEYERLVERIQVGDAKEGAAALAELNARQNKAFEARLEKLAQARPAPVDDNAIDRRMDEHRTKEEINGAVASFKDKYPEIDSDNLLHPVMGALTREELVNDLKAVGARDEDLAVIQNDIGKLARAHAALRQQGYQVRDYGAVLDSAAQQLGKRYNLRFAGQGQGQPKGTSQQPARSDNGGKPPASQQNGQQPRITASQDEIDRRLEQKRNAQQPKTAGGRLPTQTGPRPLTRTEIVNQQRKARGFPVSR